MKLQLGRDSANRPVIWESTDNANILITGRSGQGKSVQQSMIASQLAEQGYHVVFLDSANEYGRKNAGKPTNWPPENARFLDIFSPMLPIQTLFPNVLENGSLEKPELAANRIAHTFRLTMKLGNVQTSYLSNVIRESFDSQQCCPLSSLVDQIQDDAESKNHTAQGLAYRFNILQSFPDVNPDWSLPFEHPGVTIVNTSNILDCAEQTVLMEILMSNLWFHKKAHSSACPLVMMLDECHNISFAKGLTARKIIREGRKYHISGCFGTQWLEKDGMEALGDAGLKIFFRPGDTAMQYALSQLSSPVHDSRSQIRQELCQLNPGEFLYRPDGEDVIWVNAKTEIRTG